MPHLKSLSKHIWRERRSQWPRGLRRRSAAARLLRSWVRIPPWAWMFVCSECCVLSGRGLCDELITRPEESYRLWCVVVCDLETSWMRRPWPTGGCCVKKKQTNKQTVWREWRLLHSSKWSRSHLQKCLIDDDVTMVDWKPETEDEVGWIGKVGSLFSVSEDWMQSV